MFALMCQVSSTGPGFVTYSFSPGQPLAIGSYSVSATYTPSANFLVDSMSGPFAFTVNPAPPPPPPPTSETPCIRLPPIIYAMPTIIARTRSNCHHHCCRTFSRSYESGLITVVGGLKKRRLTLGTLQAMTLAAHTTRAKLTAALRPASSPPETS